MKSIVPSIIRAARGAGHYAPNLTGKPRGKRRVCVICGAEYHGPKKYCQKPECETAYRKQRQGENHESR